MKTKLASALIFICTSFSVQAENIKIGIISALSGIGASWGNDLKNSILFAREKLAPDTFDLIFEDDRCSNKDGLTAANKLIHINKVSYGLGFACSGPALAGSPIFNSNQIPLIISTASSPALSHIGEYVFRTFPHDGTGAELLYSYMTNQAERKVIVLSTEAYYNQDLKKAFEASNKEKNQLNIEYIDYLPDVVDFKSILMKAKSKKAEALFLNVQTEGAYLQAIRNFKEIGWSPKIYSAYYPGNASVLKSDIKSPDGTVFFDSPNLDKILTKEDKELLNEFQARYGEIKTSQLVFISNFEAF